MRESTTKKIRIFALILITLLNMGTLFFVAPLKENLSYLGNELGHKAYLILWGASAALYFLWYTHHLMKYFHYKNRLGKAALIIACCAMALSVILPYDPLSFPELSKWHVRIAMWGTILYVAVFFHLLYDIMKKDVVFFQKSMSFYTTLVAFDVMLFILYGSVSALLEITFTIGMSLLLYHMYNSSCV